MNITDRIYQFIDYKGISVSEFSKRTEVSNGYFAKQRANSANIGSNIIEKIVSAYPELNLTWLVLGMGNMISSEENVHPFEDINLSIHNTPKSTQFVHPFNENEIPIVENDKIIIPRLGKSFDRRIERQEVPLYDFDAVAGLVPVFNGQEKPVDYISIPNLAKVDGAVPICGDSMYPLLKSGDIVMYKIVNDFTNIIWGEMYLISICYDDDEYISVKYLNRVDEDPKRVLLVSYNTHHSPKEIPLNSIRALGLIKATIRFNTMG